MQLRSFYVLIEQLWLRFFAYVSRTTQECQLWLLKARMVFGNIALKICKMIQLLACQSCWHLTHARLPNYAGRISSPPLRVTPWSSHKVHSRVTFRLPFQPHQAGWSCHVHARRPFSFPLVFCLAVYLPYHITQSSSPCHFRCYPLYRRIRFASFVAECGSSCAGSIGANNVGGWRNGRIAKKCKDGRWAGMD